LQEESKALGLHSARIHAEIALTAALGGGYGLDAASSGPESAAIAQTPGRPNIAAATKDR